MKTILHKSLSFFKFILLVLLVFFVSCSTTPKVLFKEPVDTKTKLINVQSKTIYSFADSSVYFSNRFEGARLNGVDQLNDSTYVVHVLPENEPINHSPFYAFDVWSKSPKKVNLHFKYPEGYKHRYLPKIKTKGIWAAADSLHFSFIDEHASLKLTIDSIPKIISGQELHTSSVVYSWVEQLIEGKENYVRFLTPGKTKLKRPFRVLDIYKGSPKNKPVIVLLTRQHPPEVTGYFAFQAFLTTLLEENKLSDRFLQNHRILAFPLMNPDGVDLGHWRHNAGGVDTNRDWSVYHQPEIKNTVQFITKVLKKNNSKLVLGIDFHSTWYDVFYTNKERETTALPNFLPQWFSALEAHISDYRVNEKASNSTKPVSKGWFLYGHKAVGVTYEIGDDTPRDRIQLIGKESAKAMMQILNNDFN